MQNHVISSPSSDETQLFGKRIGSILKRASQSSQRPEGAFVIALHGDLGAGKTTLTQGIAAGLGVTQPVTSPTYTLINEYALDLDLLLVHVDSYRLADGPSEMTKSAALGIGLDELLDDERAILIIEWASYLADLLPVDHLAITLEHGSPENRHTTSLNVETRQNSSADPQTSSDHDLDHDLDHRQITCHASGPNSQAILAKIIS